VATKVDYFKSRTVYLLELAKYTDMSLTRLMEFIEAPDPSKYCYDSVGDTHTVMDWICQHVSPRMDDHADKGIEPPTPAYLTHVSLHWERGRFRYWLWNKEKNGTR